MPEQNQGSSAPFACGAAGDCGALDRVFHVTHVENAVRIIRGGTITAGLVYDTSVLNAVRILVVWLSPNTWGDGSRYGNVAFEFDWRQLVAGRNVYWVGSMPYGVVACRVLVTRQQHPNLLPYNPALHNGPWWHDVPNDRHYWKPDVCLEVIFEDDLPVRDALSVGFVSHHPAFCCIDPAACTDKGKLHWKAARELVARLALAGRYAGGCMAPHRAAWTLGWQQLLRPIEASAPGGGAVARNDPVARPLARAVLDAIACEDRASRDAVGALFAARADLIEVCRELVAETLGVGSADLHDD